MKAVFISDVHILEPECPRTSRVLEFLETRVAGRYDRLYILGDFFDAWPKTSRHLIAYYQPVLKVLSEIQKSGTQVYYLEGNHDFHLGDYFPQALGFQTASESFDEVWEGRKIHLTHGDLGNPQEKSYLRLRKVLKSTPFSWALGCIPGWFLHKGGLWASKWSRNRPKKTGARDPQKIRKIYRRYAEQKFRQGHDVVIFGHIHLPDDYEVEMEGRTCRYLNTGDWVTHFSYVEFDGEDFYTKRHLTT